MQKEPVTAEYIVAVFDLENFSKITKESDSKQIFAFLGELHRRTIDFLAGSDLAMIKNMGDAELMAFTCDRPDDTVSVLRGLKEHIESFLRESGYSSRASFSCHVGEITLGPIGRSPFMSSDAFGEAINTAFQMNGRPFRNRFVISPQLFRRLEKEGRKDFHKFTPPVVYLAE